VVWAARARGAATHMLSAPLTSTLLQDPQAFHTYPSDREIACPEILTHGLGEQSESWTVYRHTGTVPKVGTIMRPIMFRVSSQVRGTKGVGLGTFGAFGSGSSYTYIYLDWKTAIYPRI
jgi:hypothetical protein